MTREEAVENLKVQQKNSYDTHGAHENADEILCALLTSLGYDDVVKEYEKIEKWYS